MVLGMTQTVEDLRTRETLLRENRTLRWKIKLLGKQTGKQGTRIYELRNENAALRAGLLVSPGDRERLFAQLREVQADNQRLCDMLSSVKVPIGDNMYAQTPEQAAVLDRFIETGE